MNVVEAFESLFKEIKGNPSITRLIQIREYLDDPVLEFEVLEYGRGRLDPDEFNSCIAEIRSLQRLSADKSDNLSFTKEVLLRSALPFGVALMVASTLSILLGTVPDPSSYVALLLEAVMVVFVAIGARDLNIESRLYSHMDVRGAQIVDKLNGLR